MAVASLYHPTVTTGKPPYLFNKIKFRRDVHAINVKIRECTDTVFMYIETRQEVVCITNGFHLQ